MNQLQYNNSQVRKLLLEAFDEQKLREICTDTPDFRSLADEKFAMGIGKAQMVQYLIDYSDRYDLWDRLLKIVKREAPGKYAAFKDTLIDKTFNIREFLKYALYDFTPQELRQFSDELKSLDDRFIGNSDKRDMVRHLLDYIEDYEVPIDLLERLLAVAQRKAPDQYHKNREGIKLELELLGAAAPQPEKRIETPPSSNLPPIPDESEQLQKLLIQNTRILYELQLQEAQYGIATPPHIKIQIEDLENKIDELKRKLHLKG